MKIGDRIRAARKAARLSQEELARRAEMSLNGFADIERGHIGDPHYSSLKKIADGLGVPVGELLEDYPKVGAPALVTSPEDVDRREPASIEISREAFKEVLKQVGMQGRYLPLSGYELLTLYRAAPSIEAAERITEELLAERRALDENPSDTPIPGEPTRAYFLSRLTALRGMGEVAAREAEAAAKLNESEQQARVEDIEVVHDRATSRVLAGTGVS